MTFRLETERLVIRPFQPEDRDGFRAIAQDALVMRYINGGIPLTEQQIDEALERQRRHLQQLGFCFGMILEKASGRVIGTAGTQPLGTTGELEIGWWLAAALGWFALRPLRLPAGTCALGVLAWYGVGRFWLEPLRESRALVGDRVRIDRVIAAALAIGAGIELLRITGG